MIPLTVREAPQGSTWGPEVLPWPGLELLRAGLERRLPDLPVTRLTGLRLSEVGLAMTSAWMPASAWWQSAAGVFLGGTTAFVADMALGSSVLTSAPPGMGVTTSELSVSFLRAPTIRSQTIIGRGRLIHATRSLGLAEATLADARGRLLGHASSRCVLFRADPEILAVRRLPETRASDLAEPYLREVEGEVWGQEYWDATPGLAVMQRMVDGNLPPCFRLLGIRGVAAREGAMTMSMAASGWLCDGFGVVYGGAIAYLADAAITLAAGTTVPPATGFSTIDLKLYLLRPVLPADGELIARATVTHRGRTMAIVNCEITGPDGALVAQAAGSVLILPERHWTHPIQVADEITAESCRVLTTVLFTDIIDSTRRAAELGDGRWRQLLAEHHAIVREQIRRFRGREVDTAGDGFLIAFDGAARAVRCAMAVREHLRRIGLEVRAGVHAGECEESGGKLVGIAVHIGSRLLGLAQPGEVLASSTVRDLVAGSGIGFDDRGEHTLKGIAGRWHLYAARDGKSRPSTGWRRTPEGGRMPAGFPDSRPLGASGIEVSSLSLGSWRTYERLPAPTGVAIVRAARDEGINFFDDARYDDETGTAPMRTGYSEVLFGELFRGAGLRRDEAVVANKLWWEFWPEQGAAAELDASLQRMRFDHVDLIYANAPPPGMAVADLVAATAGLVTSGKARAWGLVNWPADLAVQAVEAAAGLGVMPPCAVQLPHSLVRRSWVEDPVMTRALETSGAGLIASFCLAGGVLTGKYRTGPAAGRAAGTLDEPRVAPAVAAAGELTALAGRLDTTAAALALAFPFTHPALTSVLFGATSPEQVRANCAVIGLMDRLSPADLADLQRIGVPEDQAPHDEVGQPRVTPAG